MKRSVRISPIDLPRGHCLVIVRLQFSPSSGPGDASCGDYPMAAAPVNPFDPTALADGTSTLTMRDSALGVSPDLVQAGAVFNDATRLLEGGLWSKPADSSNQQNYSSMYTTDIHAVLNDISAILANPTATTVGGVAYTPSASDIAALTG